MSTRCNAGLALLCALAAGCEGHSAALVDGGVGRRLVFDTPEDGQVGLAYGATQQLVVTYEEDDAAATKLRGPVRFSIFDDPGGSTLSADTVQSDGKGEAAVTLTAGSQEKSFHVHASAAGASDLVFAVSTSALEFVSLDAVLADPLQSPGTRSFTAALFPGGACAALPATEMLSGEDRSLTTGPAAQATLSFQKLLSRSYAIVGRLEDAGRLVAYGCVDVDAALVPPGAALSVPIGLVPVTPSLVGSFTLSTSLAAPRSTRTDARFAPVDVIDRCPGHEAQLVLDAIEAAVPPARAALITAQRGVATPSTAGSSTVACRPALVGADDSLDAQLAALLDATSDGAQRATLVSDLDSILGSGALQSTLALAPTLAHADDTTAIERLVATHTATSVAFSLGAPIELAPLGLPTLVASGVTATAQGSTLALGAHALGIALPSLWGSTFSTHSVAARLPALTDATWSGWLTAVVGAAQHGGKVGCAAVEDLICAVTGASGCAGTIAPACTTATATVGDGLEATFAGDAALRLSGACTLVDSTGDLVTDSLASGLFQSTGPITSSLSFTGTRAN